MVCLTIWTLLWPALPMAASFWTILSAGIRWDKDNYNLLSNFPIYIIQKNTLLKWRKLPFSLTAESFILLKKTICHFKKNRPEKHADLTRVPLSQVEAALDGLLAQVTSLQGSEAWQRASHLLPRLLGAYRDKTMFMQVYNWRYIPVLLNHSGILYNRTCLQCGL